MNKNNNALLTPQKNTCYDWNRSVFWAVFFIVKIVSAFWLAWFLLSLNDFSYRQAYSLIDSHPHILHFAPRNLYKQDFAQTTPEDHIRLFGEINRAVHNHGQGLESITYSTHSQSNIPLLHQAEIIHLQDVANLIDVLRVAGWTAIILWMGMIAFAKWKKWQLPKSRHILMGFLAVTGLLTLMVLLIGPTRVFYWGHQMVFPDEHQWFFYYEESLMTTLMKAPDLFAVIAVLLVIAMSAIFAAQTYLTKCLLRSH